MRTIYIVDDDDAVRASVQGLLSLRSNLIIRAFRSGDLFLAALDDCDPGSFCSIITCPGRRGSRSFEGSHRWRPGLRRSC